MKTIGIILIFLVCILIGQLFWVSEKLSRLPTSYPSSTGATAEAIASAIIRNGSPQFIFRQGGYGTDENKNLGYASLIVLRKGGAADSLKVFPQPGLSAELISVQQTPQFDRYKISFKSNSGTFPHKWHFTLTYHGQYQMEEKKEFIVTYAPTSTDLDPFNVTEKNIEPDHSANSASLRSR